MEYALQLKRKTEALKDAAGFGDIRVFSGDQYHFRTRMDMVFTPRGLGLREKGNRFAAVDIDRCPVSNERLNELLSEVRDFFKTPDCFDLRRHTGTLRYAVIRTPEEDSSVSFVLNKDSEKIGPAIEKISEFSLITSARNVLAAYVQSNRDVSVSGDFTVLKGGDMLKESYLGREFFYNVQGFFQNNHPLAEMMHEHCRGVLRGYDTNGSSLVDLYGGVGTFGIINAGLFKEVISVESSEEAVRAAGMNIEKNKAWNVRTVVLDAKNLKGLALGSPLFVITDPPRAGMHPKTIKHLNALMPQALLYVSCNVKQLGEDMKKLEGFGVRSAALFDLFPHTPHSEAIVELAPKK